MKYYKDLPIIASQEEINLLNDYTPVDLADLEVKVQEIRTSLETSKARESFKAERLNQVQNIKVTTTSGKEFDGNEEAQGRMARAILVLDDIESTLWVLADNTPAEVTKTELKEALKLAGQAQTNIWIQGA